MKRADQLVFAGVLAVTLGFGAVVVWMFPGKHEWIEGCALAHRTPAWELVCDKYEETAK